MGNTLVESLNELDNNKPAEASSLLSKVTDALSSSSSDTSNDWVNIINRKVAKSKKDTDRLTYDDYDNLGLSGKNSKKKRDKDGLIDYDREFNNEIAILKAMEVQQTKFVDDLTKEYNNMRTAKSSARGITKYMTDLIESISSARTVNIQIVKEIIAAKKIIAELSIKEREKLLKDTIGNGQENMSDYANTFMKELIKTGRNNIVDLSPSQVSEEYEDYDSEDIYREIVNSSESTMMSDEDREREAFLKYENKNVTISVVYDDDDGDWEFVAQDENGNTLPDYPLPSKTNGMSFNKLSGVATDKYGQKYNLIIQ